MERGRASNLRRPGVVTARRFPVVRVLIAVAVVALLVIAGRKLGALIPAFTTWVDGLGVWGPVAFVAGYALATVAFVPGSLLTLAAGAIFGLGKGTALVLVAATLGASAAFLVSRYVARGFVEPSARLVLPRGPTWASASITAATAGTSASPRSTAPSGLRGGRLCCCSGSPRYFRSTC